ncbi:MAG: GGDEF domain-containing protein, partial [Sulfurimonadaceae bacterium]
ESHIRANDFLFRVGGEEFVLIFAKTSLENAKIAAEKIRNLVATKLATIEDKKITISIGLSQSRTNDTEESLYERVDMLLYESKKSGKNKVTSG